MGKLALLFILGVVVYQSHVCVTELQQQWTIDPAKTDDTNEKDMFEVPVDLQRKIDFPTYLILRRRSQAANMFRKRASERSAAANDIERTRRFENGWLWNF